MKKGEKFYVEVTEAGIDTYTKQQIEEDPNNFTGTDELFEVEVRRRVSVDIKTTVKIKDY